MLCVHFTLRCDKTFFKATLDTGSPASFVNERTADCKRENGVESVPSSVILSEKESPIVTMYVYYNRKRIELMGTLVVYVSSLGWIVKQAKFLISENRTPCLLGLDLQSQLGVRTTQIRPPRPLVGNVFQSDINETSEIWRSHFHKKYQHVFFRIGRAKSHQIFSTFKSPLILNQENGGRDPVHIQDKVDDEIRKIIQEGHIVKLNKYTIEHFISLIVITSKKDGSVKWQWMRSL